MTEAEKRKSAYGGRLPIGAFAADFTGVTSAPRKRQLSRLYMIAEKDGRTSALR
jgi:hypothetical protein